MKLAINSFAECIGIANAITNTYTFVDKKVINMTMQKWYPLKEVSLVVVVKQDVADEWEMESCNDSDNTDKLINAYGLDFNQVLNQESKTVWHGATKVEEGVYAMIVPDDLPDYLPRLIGQGMRIDLQDCVDKYIVVHMHKVNLLYSCPEMFPGFLACGMVLAITDTTAFV